MSVERVKLSASGLGTALNVERSGSTVAVDQDNPWPGLASFTEENSGFFFGRDKETTELVRLIRRNVLTVLFGQSGLGKSSLLQAGAFPALRAADYFPLYVRLDHDPAAPALADQVKAALGAAFAAGGIDATAPQPNESLWEYFHRKDVDHWSAKNRLLTPVLAFDQFEEIFTLGNADEARRTRARIFLTELADLVQHRVPSALRERFERGELNIEHFHFDKASCHIVLSLREDFLPNLEGLKQEMRSVMRGRMRVQRLNGLQALEIVQRPAPHLLAEGVAERIVEFVAGARGGSAERLAELEVEPALLSVICRELNERRKAAGQAQITADLVTGNRREILTDFYERSVVDLPPDMRTFVEDHLLTKSGFRDNLALETALEFPGVTRKLIDTLVSRRLLRLEDRLGVQRVELTHDVLAEVIRGSRDSRQQRLAIEKERQRERLTRRRMWLARTIAAGLLVICAGVSWIAWRAVRAEREQGRLRANEVSLRERADALRQKAERQELAALRMAYASDMNGAQYALGTDNLGRARELLYRHRPKAGEVDLRGWEWRYLWQFCQSDALATIIEPNDQGSVISLAASADGKWLAAGAAFGGRLSLLNLETNEKSRVPAGNGTVYVAFSPQAPLLAIAIEGKASGGGAVITGANDSASRVLLWDVNEKQVVREVSLAGVCNGLSFSGNGQTLAIADFGRESVIMLCRVSDGAKTASWNVRTTASNFIFSKFAVTPDLSLAAVDTSDGTISVIDLDTGAERRAINAGAFSGALALSPDGRTLASSSGVLSEPAAIRLWDVSSGRLIGHLEGHQARAGQLVFLPDGKRLISASADQTLRLWDINTQTSVRAFHGHQTEVWRVAMLPNGQTMVSGCKDGSVYRWDLNAVRDTSATGTFGVGLVWAFAENGKSIVTIGSAGSVVKRSGPGFREINLLMDVGRILSATLDPDRPLLAALTAARKLQVWDWERRVLVREFDSADSQRASPQQFSKDGSKLVVRLFASMSDLSRSVVGFSGVFSSPKTFSHREWDIRSGKETHSFEFTLAPTTRASGAYSADGTQYIALSYPTGHAQLLDLITGASTALNLDMSEPGSVPAFSADGQLLMVPSLRSYVRVFDLRARQPVAKLAGYMFGVHSGTFSSDGSRIATGGSAFEGIMLWDAQSYERVLTLPAKTNVLSPIAFSPDGSVLAGKGTPGSTLHFWRAPTWAEIEAAERAAAKPAQ